MTRISARSARTAATLALAFSAAWAAAGGARPWAVGVPTVFLAALVGFSGSIGPFVERRKREAVVLAFGLLVAWNLILMDQYRRNLLPADDTISFVQVIENWRAGR